MADVTRLAGGSAAVTTADRRRHDRGRQSDRRWVWLAVTGMAAATAFLLYQTVDVWAPLLAGVASVVSAVVYVARR